MLITFLSTQKYPQNDVYIPRFAVSGLVILFPDSSVSLTVVEPGLCDQRPLLSWRYQWKSCPGAMTRATL
jgi:hypothetical protein